MSRRKMVVFDLDGTLADLSHRLFLIKNDKPQWDKFYNAVGGDDVNRWCAAIMYAMHLAGHLVVIVSARPKTTRDATEEWLDEHGIVYDDLHLLRNGNKDYRPDVDLKREWCKQNKQDILFVVDDRQRVVDMWREEGVTCLQCAAWEEFKRRK